MLSLIAICTSRKKCFKHEGQHTKKVRRKRRKGRKLFNSYGKSPLSIITFKKKMVLMVASINFGMMLWKLDLLNFPKKS